MMATTVKLIEVSPAMKERLMCELFGRADEFPPRMIDLTLPKNAGNTLSMKKIKSLSKKYFSIPYKFLKYYPKFESSLPPLEPSGSKTLNKKRKLVAKNDHSNIGKRKVGRPKKVFPSQGLTSITKFFRPT